MFSNELILSFKEMQDFKDSSIEIWNIICGL